MILFILASDNSVITGIEIGPHVDALNVNVDQEVNVLNPGNFNEDFDKNFFKHEKVNNIFFDDSSD